MDINTDTYSRQVLGVVGWMGSNVSRNTVYKHSKDLEIEIF